MKNSSLQVLFDEVPSSCSIINTGLTRVLQHYTFGEENIYQNEKVSLNKWLENLSNQAYAGNLLALEALRRPK